MRTWMLSTSFITVLGLAHAAHSADLSAGSAPAVPTEEGSTGDAGFYLGTRNTFGTPDDTDFSIGGGGVNISNQYDFGFGNGIIVGYNFSNVLGGVGLRGELEFSRSQFSIDTHTVAGTQIDSGDSFGELRAYTGFANLFFDIDLASMSGAPSDGFLSKVKPFVGGGVGYSNVELRKMGVSAVGVVMDDDDSAFAYNISAGVGVEVFEKTTLELGYRYMSVADLEFNSNDGTASQTDYDANLFTVGLRRQF
jgi:opacity protein-like surface antigen